MNFVNKGTDLRILKSMPSEILEILEKAHPGTVPTQVWVDMSKDGKQAHMTTVYKKVIDDKQAHMPTMYKKVIDIDNLPHSRFINSNYHYFNSKNHKIYTLRQIVQYYNELPAQKQKDFEKFITDNYFISDGESVTSKAYKLRNGKYSPGRFKHVHKPIIDRKLSEADTPPKGVKPICFIFGGGSASGKSTVVNLKVNPIIENTGLRFAHMDCDELKAELPEYEMFRQENINSAAGRVHRESSDLCMECIHELIKQGKCFTYDGVMGNLERTKKLVTALKEKGYEIHIVAVDVPVDIALERASQRDRKISEEVIRRAHRDFAKAFPETIKLPVDSFALYDNSQPPGQPPVCIVNSDGVQHQEYYERFMKKSREASNNGK